MSVSYTHLDVYKRQKLDGVDYAEKLTAILRENEIKSVTVVRMQVPCCGGLEPVSYTHLDVYKRPGCEGTLCNCSSSAPAFCWCWFGCA